MAAKINSRSLPSTQLPSPRTIDRIDRYQLLERIGRGGMAEVFRAKMQSIGGFERHVAVKVLLPNFASESEFVEMLLDEARIAGGIDHPNVLQVIDVGRQAEIFYLVMELVEGKDLRTIAKSIPGGRLPLGMTLYVMSEMLRGLHAVHTAVDENGQPRNIIHRDISPANVLIDRRGFVKLGDFGIAHASGRITRTRVGAIKGKSRYMAPEQLAGQGVDARSDLYAVGVTMFEALFGDFARASSRPTIFGPMFTWPDHLPGGLPSAVEQILRRLITEHREHRYRDAAELRHDIDNALHRIAPGYGPDAVARELVHLGIERAPLDLSSAHGVDHTERVQANQFVEAVGVRHTPWQGNATAENLLPSEHSGPFSNAALTSRSTTRLPSQRRVPSRPIALNSFAYSDLEATVLPHDLRPIAKIPSWSDKARRQFKLGAFASAFALLCVGIAALVATTGSAPPVVTAIEVPTVAAVMAPKPRSLPLSTGEAVARDTSLTNMEAADRASLTSAKARKRHR